MFTSRKFMLGIRRVELYARKDACDKRKEEFFKNESYLLQAQIAAVEESIKLVEKSE